MVVPWIHYGASDLRWMHNGDAMETPRPHHVHNMVIGVNHAGTMVSGNTMAGGAHHGGAMETPQFLHDALTEP